MGLITYESEMVTLRGPDPAPPAFAIEVAVNISKASPCQKSKRGAVIYCASNIGDPDRHVADYIDGAWGWNSPPARIVKDEIIALSSSPLRCDGSAACRNACSKRCVHAEQRALMSLAHLSAEATVDDAVMFSSGGLHLVHTKVVDGKLVAGGGPSCVDCSKLMLDFGLAGVWLYEEVKGAAPLWRHYGAAEFHEASLLAANVYEIR